MGLAITIEVTARNSQIVRSKDDAFGRSQRSAFKLRSSNLQCDCHLMLYKKARPFGVGYE